jgi:cytochrome c551/c552
MFMKHFSTFARAAAACLCCLAGTASVLPAHASALLALEKGCMSCHGTPPKKNAPDFATLAKQLAPYRGQAGADVKLADKLREHHVFGGIKAHENLSEASALTLVRWVIDGAQ